MKKKFIAMISILALVFTSVMPVSAMEMPVGGKDEWISAEYMQVNPIYEDVIDEQALEAELNVLRQYAIQPLMDGEYCTTKDEVSNVLRQAMVNRVNVVTIEYKNAVCLEQADLSTMIKAAMAETDNPKEGDYLTFQYGGWQGSYSGKVQGGIYYLTVTYTISYYTTLEQEQEMDAAVARVLEEIGITGKISNYEKVCKIYDYICSHVTYDYTNLVVEDYKLKYTAYAALINGTSVCQGYANLFYRLAKEAGLSTRIVRGWQTSTNDGHAWNIVKLGDQYYNLDATWDSAYVEAGLDYAFFLKGWTTFEDHTFDADYTTEAFLTEYPMSTEAYVHVPGNETEEPKDISEMEANLSQDTFVYNRSSHMPDVIIEGLEKGIDYEVEYRDNVYAGQATVVVCGIGKYCGEITLPFTIEPANIANVDVFLDQTVYHYIGKPVQPVVNAGSLVEGKDFEISYSNNNGVGTGAIVLTGKGNYTGTKTVEFEILECEHQWGSGIVTLEPNCAREGVRTYTCALCQDKKTESIPVNDNHNMSEWVVDGEATCGETGLKIRTCQNGCGKRDEEVVPALPHTPVEDAAVAATCVKTGLTAGSHCGVCGETITAQKETAVDPDNHSFTNYVSDGNATCTADGTKTAKCDNCTATDTVADAGSKKKHTEKTDVVKATTTSAGSIVTKCADCKETLKTEAIPAIDAVALSYEQKVYTGKAIDAPELNVTDTEGNAITSYDVTGLTAQTAVGRYKVTVTFKGNYEGSTELYFTIVPKKVFSATAKLNSADVNNGYNDIKFTWKKSAGANGYMVYYKKASASKWSSPVSVTKTTYTKKNLAAGTKYTFKVVPYYKDADGNLYYDEIQYKTASTTTLKKVTGIKVVKSGSKVKVSWKNIDGETGYQISKMTKKSATQKTPTTVKSATAKSKVIAATKGKTYYYKVRAYKVVDGKKVYGPWSAPKAFKRK